MQDFFFKQNVDFTYCVTGYRGDEEEVIIPDSYCGASVTILNDRIFAGHKEKTSIHIPDTVTSMGAFLFEKASMALNNASFSIRVCGGLNGDSI